MSEYPHLENAPIREALIDIQVQLPEGTTIEDIKKLGELVKSDYPQTGKRWKANIELKPEEATDFQPKQIGYVFISDDKKQIIQARLNGFTFSRLKQYETWEKLRDEALRLWQIYKKHLHPLSIERVACRYINEIKLKVPVKLRDYLTAPPLRPESAPEELASFLTRVVIPYEQLGATAIVTQALEKVADDGTVPIILDIDVFKSDSFDIGSTDAWDTLDKFREVKNQLFFNSIEKKTVELFKWPQ